MLLPAPCSQLESQISSLESDLSKALEDNRALLANRGGDSDSTPPLAKSPVLPAKPKVRVHNTSSSGSSSSAINAAKEEVDDGPDSPYLKLAASSIGLAAQPKYRPKVSRLSSHSVDAIRRDATVVSTVRWGKRQIFLRIMLGR